MYNIVVGIGSYAEIIIDLLEEKNKLVIAIDKKENLQRIDHKKIVKIKVNIDNVKLVESAIANQEIESIYVVTDDDKLNLMLGEQLANYKNINILLSDEKFTALSDGNYKIIRPSLIVKEFIKNGVI